MTDIFIRKSDGKEFEIKNWLGQGDEELIIKPIKAEKKLKLWYKVCVTNLVQDDLFNTKLELTETQAQAVAEAIKALMEYIQTPITGFSINNKPEPSANYDDPNYINLADKARKKMQKESDNE